MLEKIKFSLLMLNESLTETKGDRPEASVCRRFIMLQSLNHIRLRSQTKEAEGHQGNCPVVRQSA